jgi:hypothetical protein
MSLARRERRALHQIEAGIRRSDPGLAQFLGGFGELPADRAVPPVRPGAARDRRPARRALARSAVRLAAHGAAAAIGAVCAPGLRERLGVRSQPQPMARAPWQRFT